MVDQISADYMSDTMTKVSELFKPSSVLLAQKVADLANSEWNFSSAIHILDVECGPGTVVEAILEGYSEMIPDAARIHATDSSFGMITQAEKLRKRKIDEKANGWSRLELNVLDVQNLYPIKDKSISHITAGFLVFTVLDPWEALTELRRVLTDASGGGVLALSSWQQSDWLDLCTLIGEVRPQKEGLPFRKVWSSPEGIERELEAIGYRDVKSFVVDVRVPFDDYQTLVDFCVDKAPHMQKLTSDMTESEMQELRQLVMSELKRRHPTVPAHMDAKAILASGRK